jgi:hypothetical protein
MKTYDLVLTLIVAFLLVKTMIATSLNRQVQLKGSVSGMFIGNLIMFAAICLLVFVKLEQFQYPWMAPAGMIVFLGASLLVKSGIAEGGLVYNGRRIPFTEMEFYAIEGVTEKRFLLRIHGANKEYVMAFHNSEREEVENRLKEHKIKLAERVSPRERKNEQ